MTSIRVAIIVFVLTTAYVFVSVGVTQVLFNSASKGSLIVVNGSIKGSKLIGQSFTKEENFYARPSYRNYNNHYSGNSNISYLSRIFLKNIKGDIKKTYSENKDLNILLESASGLDPHITKNSALSQVERISRRRRLEKEALIALINKHSKKRILNFAGEEIVNVVELNTELNK